MEFRWLPRSRPYRVHSSGTWCVPWGIRWRRLNPSELQPRRAQRAAPQVRERASQAVRAAVYPARTRDPTKVLLLPAAAVVATTATVVVAAALPAIACPRNFPAPENFLAQIHRSIVCIGAKSRLMDLW